MALTFSTADVHPRDRLAYWRETVTVRFPKLELKSGVGPAFEAGARIHQLADLIVTEFECDPCEAVRDRPRGLLARSASRRTSSRNPSASWRW